MYHLRLLVLITATITTAGEAPSAGVAVEKSGPPTTTMGTCCPRLAKTAQINFARTAEVAVSSQQEGFPKANLIDGDRKTEWASNGGHAWLKLHWRSPVKVGRLVVCDRADRANKAQAGKILFSDGSTLDIDDIRPGGAPREISFPPRMVTWLRIDLFGARGKHPGLAEIEVYADGGGPATMGTWCPPPPASCPAAGTLVTIAGNDPRIVAVDGVRDGKWCGAMWCPFAGTKLQLFAATGPDGGLADVYIDGIWRRTADWFSAAPVSNAVVFTADNLPDGRHLLGILARGTGRAASQGTKINWSRIEYVAGSHPERYTPVPRTRFDPNVPLWLDDRGAPVQCHMGGVMVYQGKYYMVGVDWRAKKLPGFIFDWWKNEGLAVYSSPDLMNWTCHGNSCAASSDPAHPLYNFAISATRPKLLPARGSGKFVALFEMVDETFREVNVTAAAVADKPEGPYRWHGILRLGRKPVQGADTAVFSDDDGKQYLITGRPDRDFNQADCLYQLAPDCLSAVQATVLGTGGEAPAIFKHDGIYYLLHSHLTGLTVNDNFYHTATDIRGPWQARGKIARGDHAEKTFLTQTTDVVPVAGKEGAFVWIGDSIRDDAKSYSRTVWLPVTIKSKGELEIRWRDSWDLSVFGQGKQQADAAGGGSGASHPVRPQLQ